MDQDSQAQPPQATPPVASEPAEEQKAPEQNPLALKVQELEDKWKRTAAEMQNYRQQVERDKIEFVKFACEKALASLLPVLDNFKRASAHLPEDLKNNDWAKGVTAIEIQFEEILDGLGLKKISIKSGEDYNPNQHEVVATTAGEKNKIIDVLEDGYELNGKILRPAKVRVGS